MTVIGTLWGLRRQRQSRIILSVAALNGFELNLPEFSFENKPAEFLQQFPYGKIPAFEGTDGFKLIEGGPIARYVSGLGADFNLLGANLQETALVDQWVHYAEHEIGSPLYGTQAAIYGYGPFNRETFDDHSERIVRALKHLESHLAAQKSGYVALDRLTLADFVVAGLVVSAAGTALGSAERAQYPAIFEHYGKVTGDERVKQYWGTDEFVDAAITEPVKAQ